ncbi:helix-turn-helix domain-containing protein, partial [Frankia casuarinae]|uniref:helix-turn-helix domain-containing protein n=3 Tax=Frankia TaxID=1854 RepID=UPI001F601C70
IMADISVVERRTYTVDEVAVLLGVSRGVAYVMVRSGEIPAIRAGVRRWVVPRARFDAWIAGRVEAA